MKTIDGVEKPLEKFTLKEAKKMCEKGCAYCCFQDRGICENSPRGWILSEKPKFTEQEIEAAKAIKLLFGDCSIIKDEKCKKVHIVYCDSIVSSGSMEISIFPSIENLKSYRISEIIGDADA